MSRFRRLLIPILFAIVLASACGTSSSPASGSVTPIPPTADHTGIHNIKHAIFVMQENRSFDTYFGTYPGANGFPTQNGKFSVCITDAPSNQCVYPFHDASDVNGGGPHGQANAVADINGGKMDGFIGQVRRSGLKCAGVDNPACGPGKNDVMGYHDAREIPNYWAYAQNFVLQDNLFEPNASWSLPQHLFMVSEWSAKCSRSGDPQSCINALQSPANPPDFGPRRAAAQGGLGPDYAWTDLTYLLHKNNVSWKYYVEGGTQPDCADDQCCLFTGGAALQDARHLESAPLLRYREAGWAAQQRHRCLQLHGRLQEGHAAGGELDHAE